MRITGIRQTPPNPHFLSPLGLASSSEPTAGCHCRLEPSQPPQSTWLGRPPQSDHYNRRYLFLASATDGHPGSLLTGAAHHWLPSAPVKPSSSDTAPLKPLSWQPSQDPISHPLHRCHPRLPMRQSMPQSGYQDEQSHEPIHSWCKPCYD